MVVSEVSWKRKPGMDVISVGYFISWSVAVAVEFRILISLPRCRTSMPYISRTSYRENRLRYVTSARGGNGELIEKNCHHLHHGGLDIYQCTVLIASIVCLEEEEQTSVPQFRRSWRYQHPWWCGGQITNYDVHMVPSKPYFQCGSTVKIMCETLLDEYVPSSILTTPHKTLKRRQD